GACTHPAGNAGAPCGATPTQVCDRADVCDGVSTTCTDRVWQTADNHQCSGPSCSNTPTPKGTLAQICNGAGKTCSAPTVIDCPGGAQCQDATSCPSSSCAGDDSKCTSTQYCLVDAADPTGICVSKNPLGTACTATDQCSSGFCADGVCCNNACGNSNPNDCQ